MIIIDEAQKMSPSVLSGLLPGLRETASLSLPEGGSVSTANTIFLFISDVGTNVSLNLLLTYKTREAIPYVALRNEMKKALDEQWSSLALSRTIKDVVPFLHMEMKQIEEVFLMMINDTIYSTMLDYWRRLVVSAELITYLSGPEFVMYDKFVAYNGRVVAVATAGARGVSNSGEDAILNALSSTLLICCSITPS